MKPEEKRAYAQKVTILGSIGDAILGVLKVVIGIIFHSHALVVDGIHSFTDVFSDIFVVMITRVSHSGPDQNHPYGHEKFETIGSAALGSLLIATGGALIYETLMNLADPGTGELPGWPTLGAAAISLIVKEGLYHYTYNAGKRLDSKLIMANAWHSRSDALSSLVVLIGLIFSILGYLWVDKLAALIVALFILNIGWRFVKESLIELAETSVEPELRDNMRDTILAVAGVKSCHALRARRMGSKVIVDVNVEVGFGLTASEGHEISSWVVKNLKEKVGPVSDVTVHMDVEDDRIEVGEREFSHEHNFDDLLPLRPIVEEELRKAWGKETFRSIQSLRLHYFKNHIFPEVIAREFEVETPELDRLAAHLPWYGKTTILSGHNQF